MQAMKKEKGYSDKQNYDKMSEYAAILRDLYHFSPVIVSQLNRGVDDYMRKSKTELLPQKSDFSGSDQPYSDCDMAGILFDPWSYGLKDLKGWSINKTLSEQQFGRFRSMHILKNSYGADNQIFGYQFIGENGLFTELAHPEEINDAHYNEIANPRYKQLITNNE